MILPLCLAWAFPAWPARFPDLLEDPLLTRPPVLDTGALLPGDKNPLPCPATQDFGAPLALADAVDLALCHNPQIRAAWANIKIQAAAVGEARAAYLPTVTGTISRMNDQTRYPGSNVAATTLVRDTAYGAMNWRLFDFGARTANQEASRLALSAALSQHDAALQKTLAGVVSAYFEAQTARAVWQAGSQNEDIARTTLETGKRREARGAGARSDTLQAATALARATLDKNRAQGAWHKALSALIHVLGLPSQTGIVLANELADDPNEASGNGPGPARKELDAWLEEARARHPAIASARAQLAAAKSKVKATRADGLPTLDFSGNYFENGRPNQGLSPTRTQERTLGLVLNLPLFDGFARTYKIRAAEAQVESRQVELQDIERQTLLELVQAHADATAALGNLQASEALLAAAREAQAVSQRKFDQGAADMLEILNTQAALAEARQERIRCQMDWHSARLRLLAHTGVMGRVRPGR